MKKILIAIIAVVLFTGAAAVPVSDYPTRLFPVDQLTLELQNNQSASLQYQILFPESDAYWQGRADAFAEALSMVQQLDPATAPSPVRHIAQSTQNNNAR